MLCARVCVCVCLLGVVRAANILAVVPTLSRSHFVVFNTLLRELASRGHNVTALTTFPQEPPVVNIRDISLRPIRKVIMNNFGIDTFTYVPERFVDVMPKFLDYIEETEKVLKFKDVSELISSTSDRFDLMIYESFVDDVFLGFAHKFDLPVLTLSTCYMFPWISSRLGIPANPSYVPGFYSGLSARMSFIQRLQNTILDLGNKLFYYLVLEPRSTEIVRRHFGPQVPRVGDLVRSHVRLYFINVPYILYGARPYPPSVVDITGLHMEAPKPLPKELDRWMNESTHGVVYFSFGSMLRGATLPADKVEAFVDVFRTLKQRVLWKWEEDTVEDLPANVKIMKWLPQRDVLAHPKVKVFISHGGLLGTTEAVVSSVPILGIPMYGDQPNNVAALVEQGVAVHVPYNDIRVDTLTNALNALLYDQSFSENARQLSRRFLDRPQSALDTAVYWTEYVIRHRGAPHLQSAAVHMPWYQLWLLDVVTVLLVGLSLTVTILYYLLRTVFRLIFCRNVTSNTKLKRS